MPRPKTSFIWEYFTKKGNGEAQCDACSRIILINGGSTSNMIKHLKCKHKDLLQDQTGTNENGIVAKEEYIVLQGENYETFLQQEDSDSMPEIRENTHYQIMSPPKAKRLKTNRSNSDHEYGLKYLSENVKTSSVKEEKDSDSSLEIFAKYMISLMKDMPKKKCEEAQLKIVSVILETKREEEPNETVVEAESKEI